MIGNIMGDVESVIQDSVVTGDLHVGDVHHNTQNTHVDQSTNVELPSLDEVGKKVAHVASIVGKSSQKAAGGIAMFLKGIINRVLLFATVIVLVCGFLIYSGNVDVNELIRDLN
jgi:hypothetical protein